MGKSRIKTKTTYFIVTQNGKLRRINMSLMVIIALVVIGAMGFFAKQSYTLNQRLIAEEQQYQVQLATLNNNKEQLDQHLKICELKKEEIVGLLYFNTDSGKTADEK